MKSVFAQICSRVRGNRPTSSRLASAGSEVEKGRETICAVATALGVIAWCGSTQAGDVFEATSPYHHIRVVDQGGQRTLCFDDTTQTRISLQDPLKGHFEYTEYFHMPWLWKTNLSTVLMIGLGGASTQLAFERYYPEVKIESVEIDPLVVQVAKDYFKFKESVRQKVTVMDGRMFLRRTTAKYDVILVDAYVSGRYGSAIPQHLVTKEFMELVKFHLPEDGVVAFNVIGNANGWRADAVGAIHRTLEAVFPQVSMFTAQSSLNIVMIASRSKTKPDLALLRQRAAAFVRSRPSSLPGFCQRVERFQPAAPANAPKSPILTDDYAPVEGLATGGQ